MKKKALVISVFSFIALLGVFMAVSATTTDQDELNTVIQSEKIKCSSKYSGLDLNGLSADEDCYKNPELVVEKWKEKYGETFKQVFNTYYSDASFKDIDKIENNLDYAQTVVLASHQIAPFANDTENDIKVLDMLKSVGIYTAADFDKVVEIIESASNELTLNKCTTSTDCE